MSAVSQRPAATADHAAAFADLARLLHAASSPQATLELICRAAVFVVPGADHASITVAVDDRFVTAAGSDPATGTVDEFQLELMQGPSLDAITALDVVVCHDVRTDDRWPALQARMDAAGDVRSVLSLRLFLQEDTVGSLNLYSNAPGAFTGEGQAIGAVFAVHAVVAMQAAHDRVKAANLQAALDNSRQIGAAIGIVMARESITADAAFHRLRRASQSSNRKLRDVADDVVFTGQAPPLPRGQETKSDSQPGAFPAVGAQPHEPDDGSWSDYYPGDERNQSSSPHRIPHSVHR